MTTEQQFVALLRAALTGSEPPAVEPSRELLELAARHDLSHMVADALHKAGTLGDDEHSKNLKKLRYVAFTRCERLQYELEATCQSLERAGISFMPLKGSVLRALYPQPWYRTSCDIDVLVHPEDIDRATAWLCEELEYRCVHKGGHDYVLFAPSDIHLELHYLMVEPGRVADVDTVLEKVWEHSEGELHCRMSDAMLYFYHIAHMAKHLKTGGCGVRTFMDLWLLERCETADREGRRALLAQGGLERFAQSAVALAEHWFSGAEADDITETLSAFILRGGTYGTVSTGSAVRQRRRIDRWVMIWETVFPPYRQLKVQYPVLQRWAILYPTALIYRIASKWFGRGRRRAVKRFEQMAAVSKKERSAAAEMMRGIGLED